MTVANRPARRLRGAAAGVLALHGLGLLGLLQLSPWRDRTPAQPPPVPLVVQLIPLMAATPPPTPAAAAPPTAPNRLPPVSPRRPREPEAITLPAPPAQPAPPEVAPTVSAAPAPPASAAGLDLHLPRTASAPWRARSPALDDPRANTARASFEARLQGAMGGDGRWVEERIDADRVRFRRGDTCIELKRSQAERLDPWNQTNSPKPWLTAGSQRC